MNIRPVAFNSLNTCSPRKMNPSFAHRNRDIYKMPESNTEQIYNRVLDNPEFLADNPSILDSLNSEEMQAALAALDESDDSTQILKEMFITSPKKREYYITPNWLKDPETLRTVLDAMKNSEKPRMTEEFYGGYFKSGQLFKSFMTSKCAALAKEEIMREKLYTPSRHCNLDNEIRFNEALFGIPLS